MDSQDKLREASLREASRDRLKEAEARLGRLRSVIERRARLGFDTSEGWRLFRLTATSLASMRQSETLIEALHRVREARWSARSYGPLAAESADRISFIAGETIQAAEPAATNCHLIESGIASLCFGNADGVEVGMLGPGGIVGISTLLTAEPMPITVVATTRCRAIPVSVSELAARIGSDVNGLHFLHATVAQQWADAMVLARCNAEHPVRERVARWILTGAGHLRGAIGPLSHDRLASLLGVRRASVTVALHELEGEGAILSRRNFIEVRDESALGRLSCACHGFLLGDVANRLPAPAEHAITSTH
jgi:CRP-like cAMP-binding protein